MIPRHSADEVISRYYTADLPPSDYRVLFAAILMQAKKDAQYRGANGRMLSATLEVRHWMDHRGDPGGISFRMCCEALNLDEAAARKFVLESPYNGRRQWNGRIALIAETNHQSARTSSRPGRARFPTIRRRGFALSA